MYFENSLNLDGKKIYLNRYDQNVNIQTQSVSLKIFLSICT